MFVIEGMDTHDPHDTDTDSSSTEAPRSERTSVSNLELRRAVLGILLLGARAMSLAEVDCELRTIGVLTGSRSARGSNQVLSDLLGYQCRLGRVRRVAQGSYAPVPDAMSISMRWRCQHMVIVRLAGVRSDER